MTADVDPTPLPDSPEAVRLIADDAIATAQRWHEATAAGMTRQERATSEQLGALLRDEAGLDLAVKFVDEVARPEDPYVAAKALGTVTAADARSFLGPIDRSLLGLGTKVAQLAPPVVVPLARQRLRQIVGHLLVNVNDPTLRRHMAKARQEGFRLNVNLLGEAVLGEDEAKHRTFKTLELLQRDDVDYVSIKVSSLVSQISVWDHEGTVERVLERLRPLYRAALAKSPHAFVNLDMEEYKDLDLTLDVFEAMLGEEEFADLEAGIVLQAYLPDACPALERLIEFATQRKAKGHAGIKIRVVKGANLAMEKAEAELHDWTQAPYSCKEDVDANYLRFVERALRPDATAVMRLGVASHNLFDTAVAYHLAQRRGCLEQLDIEMLQGMAPSQARAVREDVGTVLLYTPVVAPADFDVAVSYLIRRLEENAQPQNYLHAMFEEGTTAMALQEQRFRDSVAAMDSTPIGPRRSAEREPIPVAFSNTPDSDPSLPATRAWARELASRPAPEPGSPKLDSIEAVNRVVSSAKRAAKQWQERPLDERAELLHAAAQKLEDHRGDLIVAMMHEGGKTIDQADPEVSEAVDFARYYADRARELAEGASAHTDGDRFVADDVVLVTPPWNFPVAIPIGGVLAALAAGAAAILKPAGPVPCCAEIAMAALHEAGIPDDVCQVVRTEEDETGKALIAHDDVDTVILTGASETAHLFASWRAEHPRGPRVFGETSGKNALIITPAADYDLAARDLVFSAFGHAGQKCSAASLGILVGSVATSKRFRNQLVDAVRSLRVGWPSDLGTGMGPIISAPEGKLKRALTTLEPGESWLVEPQQLDDTGRLWSPGVKEGVAPGSFFHLTEVFGPVLGLMTAKNLEDAIALQNQVSFGLTGGLHSLDPDEIDYWREHVEVGNAYINRHITGAIVQRQSFGGWKDSVVGPGGKAGGPNYVALLGQFQEQELPRRGAQPLARVRARVERYTPLVDNQDWLTAALRSDAAAWASDFGVDKDESGIAVEANIFRYRPFPQVTLRVEPGAKPVELVRLLAAAELVRSQVELSVDPAAADVLAQLRSGDGAARQAADDLRRLLRVESSEQALARLAGLEGGARVRVIGDSTAFARAAATTSVTVLGGPVLANGRRELLTFLREQSISRCLHRYGHVAPTLIP